MTKSNRRVHDATFKTKVVLEALKGVKTLAQISSDFGIHAQQITDWKRQVLDGIPSIFESPTSKPALNMFIEGLLTKTKITLYIVVNQYIFLPQLT